MGVKILSLYDGMACGMIAMQLAGVEVESYDAYEIDKYAIKTAQHNFPMIIEHGDVFEADFTQYEGVDFLIGGSPCTYWSIAQTKNRETVASGMGWELFSQYVRALHEAKPKYFIYENNKSMSKQIRASIDEAFGFEAVLINSTLVSAQNRQRLYWVGRRNEDGTYSKVNVEQPADRGILLKDVLDSAVARDMIAEPVHGMENDTKSRTLTANYWKTNVRDAFVDCAGGRTMAAEPINTDANGKAFCVTSRYYKGFGNNPGKCLEKHRDSMAAEPINVTEDGKAQCLRATCYKDGIRNIIANDVDKKTGVAEPVCVAERGRMYCGQPQHYEARTDGKTNTLTSVEKDNRVAEPVSFSMVGDFGNRKVSVSDKAYCLAANPSSDMSARVAEPVGIKHLGSLYGQHSRWGVFDEEGKAPTLTASAGMGGGHLPMIKEPVKVMEVGNGGQGNRLAVNRIHTIALTAQSGGLGPNTGLYAVPYDCDVVITENSIRCQRRDQKHSTVQGSHVNFTDGKTQTLSPSHISNVIEPKSCGDLYAIPTMPVKEATAKGYTEIECGDCVDLSMPNSKARRGRNMADKANCMQTSNDFYQYVGYVIEFGDDGRPIKAIGKDGKEITIYEVRDGKITIKGKQYPIKLKDGYYIIRKLTVSECKRLQTVPEWYEFPVSNSQAYKMLGNGWTCEVICHLINSCFKSTDVLPGQIGLW